MKELSDRQIKALFYAGYSYKDCASLYEETFYVDRVYIEQKLVYQPYNVVVKKIIDDNEEGK